MTRSILFRWIVGVVAVTLAIGAIAGPASARTFYFNSNGSLVQQSNSAGIAPASGGSSIEWGYIAIGASAAALALIAVSAGLAVSQRRGRRTRDSTA